VEHSDSNYGSAVGKAKETTIPLYIIHSLIVAKISRYNFAVVFKKRNAKTPFRGEFHRSVIMSLAAQLQEAFQAFKAADLKYYFAQKKRNPG